MWLLILKDILGLSYPMCIELLTSVLNCTLQNKTEQLSKGVQ